MHPVVRSDRDRPAPQHLGCSAFVVLRDCGVVGSTGDLVVRPARCVRSSDPSTSSDIDAVVELQRRVWTRYARSPCEWLDADQVIANVTGPGVLPDLDAVAVVLDGRLAAYVGVEAAAPYSEIEVSLYCDPDLDAPGLEGVARAGVAACERAASARDLPPDGGCLVVYAFAGDPLGEVLAAEGFEYLRSMLLMVRSLLDPVDMTALPSDVEVVTVDVDAHLGALAELSAAFADHHGDFVSSPDKLRHELTTPTARPDLSLIAHDRLGPVAAVLVSIDADGGLINQLMTLERARGQGIASGLLTRAFAGLRAEGVADVYLMVDGVNPTGALGLYLRCGMTQVDEYTLWSRPLA